MMLPVEVRPLFGTMEYTELVAEIAKGNVYAFYHSGQWQKKRKEVLALDHNECVLCKAAGRYTKATHVHHVKFLKDRPDLCLTIFDQDGQRQLISVCKDCHETKCHPDRIVAHRYAPAGLAASQTERWD